MLSTQASSGRASSSFISLAPCPTPRRSGAMITRRTTGRKIAAVLALLAHERLPLIRVEGAVDQLPELLWHVHTPATAQAPDLGGPGAERLGVGTTQADADGEALWDAVCRLGLEGVF